MTCSLKKKYIKITYTSVRKLELVVSSLLQLLLETLEQGAYSISLTAIPYPIGWLGIPGK